MPRKKTETYEDESAFDELMQNPILPPGGDGSAETGFDKAINVLTVTEDELLELMTYATPITFRASAVAYSMIHTFHSGYVSGRYNQNNRLQVSYQGRGREQIVKALSASQGAFDLPGSANDSQFMPAPED